MATTLINPFIGAGRYAFNATISSNTNNYSITAAAIAAGWNGSSPLDATITINNSIVVGSTSAGTPGFITGTPPATSTLQLTNNGTIQGKGGDGVNGGSISAVASPGAGVAGNAGGTALSASFAITIDNASGSILGGGGSGASGAAAGLSLLTLNGKECNGTPIVYGTGGSGSGGGRGTNGGTSSSGGTSSCASGGGSNLSGNTGSAGTAGANGTGGASAQQNSLGGTADGYCRGAAGGNGGGAGSAGANSSASTSSVGTHGCSGTAYTAAGATGGAAGNAVSGDSNITWTNTGTRTGPIT